MDSMEVWKEEIKIGIRSVFCTSGSSTLPRHYLTVVGYAYSMCRLDVANVDLDL